jgi:hypothetical protein
MFSIHSVPPQILAETMDVYERGSSDKGFDSTRRKDEIQRCGYPNKRRDDERQQKVQLLNMSEEARGGTALTLSPAYHLPFVHLLLNSSSSLVSIPKLSSSPSVQHLDYHLFRCSTSI